MKNEVSDGAARGEMRLIEVGALLAVILIVGSLGCMGLEGSGRTAHRIQCTNNLKYIGLGIHNFHDTYLGIPPLAIGDARASFFVSIMPFAEAGNVFNLANGGNGAANTKIYNIIDGSSATDPISTWAALAPHERDAAASVKWTVCPARRSGVQQIAMTGATNLYAGPIGDYAVVFEDQDFNGTSFAAVDTSDESGWQLHQDPCEKSEVDRQKGAIRLAFLDCEKQVFDSWKPRDTFARCTDGIANVVFVGEKHVRSSEKGKYGPSQDQQDGVYWFTSKTGERNYNVARNIGLPFAKKKDDFSAPGQGPRKDFGFGSAHAGVILFLRGDGSVWAAPVDLDEKVKRHVGHAQDGVQVQLTN